MVQSHPDQRPPRFFGIITVIYQDQPLFRREKPTRPKREVLTLPDVQRSKDMGTAERFRAAQVEYGDNVAGNKPQNI